MPGHDVYGAAFAADVERHLRANLPTCRAQAPGHDFDESGVILIEEPINSLAIEVESQVDPRPKRLGDRLEDIERHAPAPTELDPSHDRLADVRFGCQILLTPATTDAQGADAATETNQVHARIVAIGAYRPITSKSGR